MKRLLKAFTVIISIFLFLSLIFLVLFLVVTKNYKIDQEKLVNSEKIVAFYDINNEEICTCSNGKDFVSIKEIPKHVQNAFIAIEDKRFYKHNGIDYKGMLRAIKSNLFHSKIKEGGSTITQQLIKNTHLSNEKTLKRKLAEIKLSIQLEKKFSKDEILEKYLNTIYFGENCYGIVSASKHYFGKDVSELTINDSATLASIIKSPVNYSPSENSKNNFLRKNMVLQQMLKQGYITKNDYEYNTVITSKIIENPEELSGGLKKFLIKNLNEQNIKLAYANKVKIYTTIDLRLQKQLEKTIKSVNSTLNKSVIITDKNSNIVAYYSDVPEIKRQIGSTIKPIGVYAPAIENNVIHSCTKINDMPTSFEGYQPKNYKNIYNGEISAKQALAKSSNVVAVKVASYLGSSIMINYLNKMQINTTKNDENLALALGATENGATLRELSSAYSVFMNNGEYTKEKVIKNISYDKINVNIENKQYVSVFSDDTTFIVNDMLKETVNNGTAKKLKSLHIPLCAKTGTVGSERGNTDAYCISYNNSYKISVWVGNYNGELMDNSITGGTLPATISYDLWEYLKDNENLNDFEEIESVQKLKIDKIAYEKNNFIRLADDLAPKRYVFEEYFRKNFNVKEKSKSFSEPVIDKVEISVINNQIEIRLCLPEYMDYLIYRNSGRINKLVFDSKESKDKNNFVDNNFIPSTLYTYSVIPYYFDGINCHYGEEIVLEKIKSPNTKLDDNIWIDDEL